VLELMNIARVRWACRRGMLELDVLFQPFVEAQYEGLSDTDKQTFIRLLECEDPELFAWFMGHEQCPDPLLAEMVVTVRGRAAP
jgi:antitoxin CptB